MITTTFLRALVSNFVSEMPLWARRPEVNHSTMLFLAMLHMTNPNVVRRALAVDLVRYYVTACSILPFPLYVARAPAVI
jgi:hypothetical protein